MQKTASLYFCTPETIFDLLNFANRFAEADANHFTLIKSVYYKFLSDNVHFIVLLWIQKMI